MAKENSVVEEAITEAKKIGNKEVAEKLTQGHNLSGRMFAIQPVVPEMFDGDGRPYTKKELQRQVDAFCAEQKKAILTHSIGLGMGIDVPTGMAFELESLEAWAKELGFNVKRVEGHFEVIVAIDGGEYKILDATRYGANIRAIHFALTRHDPDTDEYVQRRLWSEMQATAKAEPAADDNAPVVH